jgi:hypothetical protein
MKFTILALMSLTSEVSSIRVHNKAMAHA